MGYVEDAEKVFKDWYLTQEPKITTTKIRGLLSGMSDIYNDVVRVEGEELPQDIVDRIQYLKVQFVYEYGRDKKDKKGSKDKTDGPVGRFIKEAKILDKIDQIGTSKKKFIEMERYMEALVAYHRFYGGEDE
ncbi:MAG: type III-A CRISPR-associated protein Csm2 [Oscillospiraceae bacterium]